MDDMDSGVYLDAGEASSLPIENGTLADTSATKQCEVEPRQSPVDVIDSPSISEEHTLLPADVPTSRQEVNEVSEPETDVERVDVLTRTTDPVLLEQGGVGGGSTCGSHPETSQTPGHPQALCVHNPEKAVVENLEDDSRKEQPQHLEEPARASSKPDPKDDVSSSLECEWDVDTLADANVSPVPLATVTVVTELTSPTQTTQQAQLENGLHQDEGQSEHEEQAFPSEMEVLAVPQPAPRGLSNNPCLPPTFSRQPPDGHEFPPNYADPVTPTPEHDGGRRGTFSLKPPSGFEDSGVFLDEAYRRPSKPCSTTSSPLNLLEDDEDELDDPEQRKLLMRNRENERRSLSDMRHNAAMTVHRLESDTESSSDGGIQSASTDSSDELGAFTAISAVPLAPPPYIAPPYPDNLTGMPMPVHHAALEPVTRKASLPTTVRVDHRIARIEDTSDAQNSTQCNGVNRMPGRTGSKPESRQAAYRWKSEENLWRAPFSMRNNEQVMTVKERIALFASRIDSEAALPVQAPSSKAVPHHQPLVQNGANLKHAFSSENLVPREKCLEAYSKGSQHAISNGDISVPPKESQVLNMEHVSAAKQDSRRFANGSVAPRPLEVTVSPKMTSYMDREISKHDERSRDVISPALSPSSSEAEETYKQVVSNYPQSQLLGYKRYSLGSLGLGGLREDPLKRACTGSLLSVLEPKKQSTKLKGLIIPDRPSAYNAINKSLPTIVSCGSSLLLSRSELQNDGHWKKDGSLISPGGTMSLQRGIESKKSLALFSCEKEVDSKDSSAKVKHLPEPPWKSPSASLPKYSPAFKRRSLELPKPSLLSSVSPTPPSSITSPLSPAPSSPSSICSSNASSSVGVKSPPTTARNIFQFSLSHSKPVTPVLPEKPIMSPPPPLSSGSDYEADNSENSSSALSPPLSSRDSPASLCGSPKKVPPPVPAKPPLEKCSSMDDGDSEASSETIVPVTAPSSLLILGSQSTSYAGRMYSQSSHVTEMSRTESAIIERTNTFAMTSCSTSVSYTREASVVLGKRDSPGASKPDPLSRLDSLLSCSSAHSAELVSPAPEDPEEEPPFFGMEDDDQGNDSSSRDGPFHAKPVCVTEAPDCMSSSSSGSSRSLPTALCAIPLTNGHDCELKQNGEILGELISKQEEPIRPVIATRDLGFSRKDAMDRSEHAGHVLDYQRSVASEHGLDSEDDDTHSTLSQQTEDSRQLADDSLSDATSDSYDKPLDPELRPRTLSRQRTVLRQAADPTDSVKNFRALAEKWEQRSVDNPQEAVRSPPTVSSPTHPSPSSKKDSLLNNGCTTMQNQANVKLPPSLMPRSLDNGVTPERRKSTPNAATTASSTVAPSNSVKVRENRHTAPRPTSMVEDRDRRRVSDTAWINSVNGNGFLNKTKTSARETTDALSRSLAKSERSLNTISTRETVDILGNSTRSRSSYLNKPRSVSVSDIRKAFESQCKQQQQQQLQQSQQQQNGSLKSRKKASEDRFSVPHVIKETRSASVCVVPDHKRISSIDSTASESGTSLYGSVGSLSSRDPYGSVTSLASTTSLISSQELQQLIDEANQSLEESGTATQAHEIVVVVLHREIAGSSIGVTLAGGADYEVKEITVHKVITGSLADRDGRIRKGDRIISINGKNLKGVTHREALDILKAPRTEVVLVISRERSDCKSNGIRDGRQSDGLKVTTNGHTLEKNALVDKKNPLMTDFSSKTSISAAAQGTLTRIEILKDGTGLGFSIEGGKDSPLGDRPLTVKRIFKGGAADRDGRLQVNHEIVSINDHLVGNMTRTEAWNFMKKIPEGCVVVMVRKCQ